jgi:hypothetical protein
MPIKVGRYSNSSESTPEICSIPFKSNENGNQRKKICSPSGRFIIDINILGAFTILGSNSFSPFVDVFMFKFFLCFGDKGSSE